MNAATLAWFDCFAGIAGDMALGALLDAGGDERALRDGLARLPLDPFDLDVSTTERGGIRATQVRVHPRGSAQLRTWGALRGALGDAALPEPVLAASRTVFARLAEAEGRVHGIAPEQVHFHEVGAVDTVVDVVGVALLLHQLGVSEVRASPVALGGGAPLRAGTAHAAASQQPSSPGATSQQPSSHGAVPVPGPAVLELLRGVPVHGGGVASELTTPTGAAILAATATGFGDLPPMRVTAVGYGAGERRHTELPNVVRVVLGEPTAAAADGDAGLVLETNVDDMSPELAPWVMEQLLAAGAADVWLTPIQMKKGRPALQLSVLCPPGREAALRAVLWRETSTLGVRGVPVRKWMLERDVVGVEVLGEPVRVKRGLDRGRVVNVAPEFEDCARAARAVGMPLKEVMARAQAAALALGDDAARDPGRR